MYQLHPQAIYLCLRFLYPVPQLGRSNGSTVAKRVGRLFRGLFEGSSKEEEGHHHRPVPTFSDGASATAAADDDVGGNWRHGFCCLFVG